MVDFLAAVLPGVLLPLAISAAVWPFVARHAERWQKASLGAVGLGLAYLSGHVAINGRPELAPAESSQWLFHLVALAAVTGALEVGLALRPAARLALRSLLVAALLWLTLRPLVHHSWSRVESTLWLVALGVAILVLLFSADALGRRGPSALQTAVWMATAGAGGGVLLIAGSARLGQMSGALAASLLPAVLLLWRQGSAALLPGTLTPVVLAFAGVWLNGAFYTEMVPLSGLAVAAAPLAAWAGEAPWVLRKTQDSALRQASSGRRLLSVALAVALLLLVALAGVAIDSLGAAQEDPYYY